LLKQIAASRDFAIHYVEAQKDSVTATVRGLILKAILGVLGAIVGVTALAVCTVMVFDALADLVTLAANGRQWVGQLVVGGGLLLATGVGAAVYVWRSMRTAREKTIRKYESRHHAQREKYGTDVSRRVAP
jgi:hypothetical protein